MGGMEIGMVAVLKSVLIFVPIFIPLSIRLGKSDKIESVGTVWQ
jgi:hypothetical protein